MAEPIESGERGCGLVVLGAMALMSAVAIGASVYRAHASTQVVAHAWTLGTEGTYAALDHTAPWSEPWTELCRRDGDVSRWCRSIPAGSAIVDLDGDDRAVLIHVGGAADELWALDPGDGGTLVTTSFTTHAESGELRWTRMGHLLVIGWPGEPPTLRAIGLNDGTTEWSLPLSDVDSIDWLRTEGPALGMSADGHAFDVDIATGAMHPE